jgi:hypothetical protein
VKAALRKRGKYLKKHKITDAGCKALVSAPNATYIVDGILNREYYKISVRSKNPPGEWRCQRGTEAKNQSDSWRHCIGVKDNRIRCKGVHGNGISAENLHLDMEGCI